jgi:hypothetical protein
VADQLYVSTLSAIYWEVFEKEGAVMAIGVKVVIY